jgi:CRISPR/Cas system-associated exonuclease Cas4 (RecB family)
MPTPVKQCITAWSYSRWKDYESCPAKAKYKHVDKLKEPGSAAMDRGSMIHKLAENYVKDKKLSLYPELASFSEEFQALRQQRALCEQDLAFDSNWAPVDWMARNAWLRVKMDVSVLLKTELRVIDYKTGKKNPEHVVQLSLYAMAGFIVETSAKVANSELWYLDVGELVEAQFNRSQLSSLKENWVAKTQPMLSDTEFNPTPSPSSCRYCHFRKSNHGPCNFG